MVLEVSLDGLCTLSFGLSQLHGHGSWLVYGSGPCMIQVCLLCDPVSLGSHASLSILTTLFFFMLHDQMSDVRTLTCER